MLAKSKLNSIETLMSQALIDLHISHEEFKTIVNEKKKSTSKRKKVLEIEKVGMNLVKIVKILEKIMEMHRLKKIFFLFCVYKMVDISVDTFAKNCIHTISQLKRGKESILWLRIRDIGRESDNKNLPDLVDKEIKDKFETHYPTEHQIRKYKRYGSELIKDMLMNVL